MSALLGAHNRHLASPVASSTAKSASTARANAWSAGAAKPTMTPSGFVGRELAQVIAMAVTINAWNRLNVTVRTAVPRR
jgi:hypothetical protein